MLMSSIIGRHSLVVLAMLSFGAALSACSDYRGEIWGVDYSKGVQLPPSEYPVPPPAMK
jgi:hypothetical protein